MKPRHIFAVAVVLILLVSIASSAGASSESLVVNPSFEEGSGNIPYGWTTWQWNSDPGVTEFGIKEGDAHSGSRYVTVQNNSDNDARFRQTVRVEQNSKYRISCRVKTENTGKDTLGANISIEGRLETSRDIKGTNDRWEMTELYVQTGEGVSSFVLTLGLGGYGNINTGTAAFDEVVMEKVDIIPAGASAALIEKKKDDATKQTNGSSTKRPLWLILVAVVLAAAAYAYHMYTKRRGNGDGGNTPPSNTGGGTGETPGHIDSSNKKTDRTDFIIMGVMTVIYLVIALFNLGSLSAPETGWNPSFPGESFTIELEEEKDLSRITYYCARGTGWHATGKYILKYRDENGDFKDFATINKDNVFVWKYQDVSVITDAIKVTVDTEGGALNELCLFEKGSREPVKGLEITDISTDPSDSGSPLNLFDEQEKYAWNPTFFNGTYFDEIYHARTAYEHIHGIEPYENTHPPLGKIFISLGILVFGMNPFGWRIAGALFGAAMIPIMYMFGRKMFNGRFYAFCCAFLIMFDFMHFSQTRISTIDVYVTFFVILMFYYMYDYFINKSYETGFKKSLKPLFLSGLFFGFGAASKWIALYGASGLAFLFFLSRYLEYRDYRNIMSDKSRVRKTSWVKSFFKLYINRTIAACVLFFIVIPAGLYILSYIPFMCVEGPGHGLKEVFSLQQHMYNYHSNLKATHSFSSSWWQWPVMTRPIWFYGESGSSLNQVSSIVSFGNPAVWWTGIPAFIASIIISVYRRDKKMVVVFVAVASQYLPWILVPRIAFIYHYFTIVPFIILSIVYVLKFLLEKKPWARYAVYGYLVVVMLLFLWFYPILSGMDIDRSYVKDLRWFDSWIFYR